MNSFTFAKVSRLAVIGIVLGASTVFASLCYWAVSQMTVSDSSATSTRARNDFVAFYAGAKLVAAGHTELAYDPKAFESVERRIVGDDKFPLRPMVYPPVFLLALAPLSSLDYVTAYRAWVVLTLALLMGIAWRLSPHWHTLLLVPIFPPVAYCAAAGQNGTLSAAILGAGVLLLPRRSLAAGLVFGLMAYKPHLALVLPFCLLAGRHFGALMAMAASALGTILVGLLAFGPATMAAFLPSLTTQSHDFFGAQQHYAWPYMPTVLVAALQMGGGKLAAWTMQLIAAGAAAAAVVWIWRRSTDLRWRSLAMVTAIPLMTPYFLEHDLVLLLIPVLLLTKELGIGGWRWDSALLLAATWLVYPAMFLLRLASAVAGHIQLGPVAWLLLLGYAIWAVARNAAAMPERGGAVHSSLVVVPLSGTVLDRHRS